MEKETIIDILETTKKTGKQRNYFKEYEITPEIVKTILLECGYPYDKTEELEKHSIDLASMSVFKHQLGVSENTFVSLSSCFELFLTGKRRGIITDVAWNQTIDHIINLLRID